MYFYDVVSYVLSPKVVRRFVFICLIQLALLVAGNILLFSLVEGPVLKGIIILADLVWYSACRTMILFCGLLIKEWIKSLF